MQIPQRPTVPRLSSTYLKNLPLDHQHTKQLNDIDIPSCGVEIQLRTKHFDDDDNTTNHISSSTKNQPFKQHPTKKTDNDDTSTASASLRDPIEERRQKQKLDRQVKGREFAKEQRRKRSLEATKMKEEAEQEKKAKADRLLALCKKAKKIAGDPMPEIPRQKLAKSRMKVKQKNDVNIPSEENDNDLSTYALQWALGGEEINVEGVVKQSSYPDDSIDFQSITEKDHQEYSAESKGGEGNLRYFEDEDDNPSGTEDFYEDRHNADDRYNRMDPRSFSAMSSPHNIQSPYSQSLKGNMKNGDPSAVMKYINIEDKGTVTGEVKSIFEMGLINNMGRITARTSMTPSKEKLRSDQKRNEQRQTQAQSTKKSTISNSIKMFSPSYKQDIGTGKSRPSKKEVGSQGFRGSTSHGGLEPAAASHKSSTSSGPRTVRIAVRDTKGNIVRELERPVSVLPSGMKSGKQLEMILYVEIYYDIISYHIISYHIISCNIKSYHIISYHIFFYFIILIFVL